MADAPIIPDARRAAPPDQRAGSATPRRAARCAGGRLPVALALAGALALLASAVVVVLSGSPVVLAGANSTLANGVIAETAGSAGACQSGEALPAGTTAIRLTMESDIGPSVTVRALSGTRVLTGGTVASGWTGGSVAVPVRPLARTASPVRICFKLGPTQESIALIGSQTSPATAATTPRGQTLPGRIKVEYLRPARGSWLSLASSVARRLGLGREPSGGWIALPMIALMGAALTAGAWLLLKELG